MTYFQSFIIGLIQGLTEFLPVSSSGHMMLAGQLLGVETPLALELVLHLATLVSVLIFYRKTIVRRVKRPFSKENAYLVVATIITAVIALVARKLTDKLFSSVSLLPITFSLTAGILIFGSVWGNKNNPLSFSKSAIIGISQGVACLPGISRSGTTISTALILGVNKQEATEFSFLLSVPIILGSTIIELITQPLVGIDLPVLAVGFITALVSGYLALIVVSRLMKNAALDVFSLYLIALSVVILVTNLL